MGNRLVSTRARRFSPALFFYFDSFFSLFRLSFFICIPSKSNGKDEDLTPFRDGGRNHAISSPREKSDIADALLKDSHLDRQRREDSGHSRQKTGFCNLLCHLAEKLGIRQRRENSDLQN